MDWLTRQPVVGPALDRLSRTRVWQVCQHYSRVNGGNLAGAMTFDCFLALFPLLALAASVTVTLVGKDGVDTAERHLTDQYPFLSDQLDLGSLLEHAGAVGAISAVALLFTGVGWVNSLRTSLRLVWRLPKEGGNLLVRKGVDLLVLLGLGATLVLSLGGSAVTGAVAGDLVRTAVGSDHVLVHGLLRALGLVVALGADFVLLLYLLRWLPGLHPSRRPLLQAAALGAVGGEAVKQLASGYLAGVAGKSMYGAFGTPVAILLMINFLMRLLLFCAAWTAVGTPGPARRADEHEVRVLPPEGGEGTGTESAEPRDAAPARERERPPDTGASGGRGEGGG